ncbi:MAG: phosphatase [Flavobacteriales bacterium]|nr:phosphatase [Flavobacteriales bacterium]|tara:strand:+ start:4453 stop:4944 length:492 start_codon:yes stop_codon:yes gene_type:complete
MKKKFDTLFLDRDGVINHKIENDYVKSIQDFKFIPEFIYVVKDLSLLFNRIIIITNQQGIGKGLMSICDLNEIHEYMLNTINDNNGKIDKIYFCPHLASENCFCRKPSPGMIQKAFQDYPDIDRSKSYFIGDSDSDMQAGKAEKLISIKVSSEFTVLHWFNSL